MSGPVDSKSSSSWELEVEANAAIAHKADAIEAQNEEHNMTVMQAVRVHPMAAFEAIVMSSTIKQFGEPLPGKPGQYVIVTKWQSALQVSRQLGVLIGIMIAGPLTSRIGYRYATLLSLMLLNAFIFIFYFAKTILVFFASQVLEGIPWGIFIANAPAYCSEIVPIQLRAPLLPRISKS